MAEVTTPAIIAEYCQANRRVVIGTAATISDTNTWALPLSSIIAVFVEGGNSGTARAHGYSASGGTVTFKTTGDIVNATVMAIGN